MSTFARIVDGVAVEVGVQDYPPILDNGSADKRWVSVPDDVCVGWATTNNGKTWAAPPAPEPPAPLVSIQQVDQAVQTLTAALDPNTADPSVADQLQALAVIVASSGLPAE